MHWSLAWLVFFICGRLVGFVGVEPEGLGERGNCADFLQEQCDILASKMTAVR